MRRAIKRSVVTELNRLGFAGVSSTFRRSGSDGLDLLSIQYWKYGGEFVLEFARRERGPLHTSWGEIVPEEKLDVAHVGLAQRARLEQRGPTTGESLRGFAFSGFGEDFAKYERLAAQVAALLPQVDDWLRSGKPGSHVHPLLARPDAGHEPTVQGWPSPAALR